MGCLEALITQPETVSGLFLAGFFAPSANDAITGKLVMSYVLPGGHCVRFVDISKTFIMLNINLSNDHLC